jgi:hypothetical protein
LAQPNAASRWALQKGCFDPDQQRYGLGGQWLLVKRWVDPTADEGFRCSRGHTHDALGKGAKVGHIAGPPESKLLHLVEPLDELRFMTSCECCAEGHDARVVDRASLHVADAGDDRAFAVIIERASGPAWLAEPIHLAIGQVS